jgi:hypothetical protein
VTPGLQWTILDGVGTPAAAAAKRQAEAALEEPRIAAEG